MRLVSTFRKNKMKIATVTTTTTTTTVAIIIIITIIIIINNNNNNNKCSLASEHPPQYKMLISKRAVEKLKH